MCPTVSFPYCLCLISVVCFVQLINNTGTSLLNSILKSEFIHFFPPIVPFSFVLQVQSQVCITFSHHGSFVSSGLWKFLFRLSIFSMILAVLRISGDIFYRMSLRLGLSNILSLRLKLWVWESKITKVKCLFLITSYQGAHVINTTYPGDVKTHQLTETVFASFL